jgi:hypothetical protein
MATAHRQHLPQLIKVLTGEIKQQRIRLRVGRGPLRNASITARRHRSSYPVGSPRSGASLPHAPDERKLDVGLTHCCLGPKPVV